jgi:hypothetical protein
LAPRSEADSGAVSGGAINGARAQLRDHAPP